MDAGILPFITIKYKAICSVMYKRNSRTLDAVTICGLSIPLNGGLLFEWSSLSSLHLMC